MSSLFCNNCWHTVKEADAQYCPICGVDMVEWGATDAPWVVTTNDIALIPSSTADADQLSITIGRGTVNDVRLDHPAVAEQHARLEWRQDENAWYVVDEASAKGTFLNYQQVPHGPEGWPINPDTDTIWIAPYSFRLIMEEKHPDHFEPAHLRVDAADLVRTVEHETSGDSVRILNLEPTPLSFRPGEFVALVGGSGTGKSTLMKALLGLEPAQQGSVYVNGRPFIVNGQAHPFEAMHTIVGYVPQDDVVHYELTPWEAMDYIARFRLSPDLSREERSVFIQDTLTRVELWPHRDKPIRNLSGGQRKRVNIALELLAKPRLLFLDEPTSGLDPGLDLAVMELLGKWATNRTDPRTIILVTHATENVTKCKYVAFLALGGHVVYFGPPEQALNYFGVKRFAEIYREVGRYQLPELATSNNDQVNDHTSPDVHQLVTRFQKSRDYFQFVESRRLNEVERTDPAELEPKATGRNAFAFDPATREQFRRQLRILSARYFKLIRRDTLNFIILLLQGFLVGGLLWVVSRPDTFRPRGAENAQTVLFIMACAAAWLGILNATKEIVKEQDIYARERRYGLNAASYVLSKLLVLGALGCFQMATMLFLMSLPITFPTSGALGNWSPAWLEWFITLELTLMAGLALGLFLSASTKTIDAATAAMFVLLLIQVMFAGLFFPDAAWADVFSTITFSRWGLESAGTTADLNGLLQSAIGSAYRPDKAYTFSALHLLARWSILGGYIALLSMAACIQQVRKR